MGRGAEDDASFTGRNLELLKGPRLQKETPGRERPCRFDFSSPREACELYLQITIPPSARRRRTSARYF